MHRRFGEADEVGKVGSLDSCLDNLAYVANCREYGADVLPRDPRRPVARLDDDLAPTSGVDKGRNRAGRHDFACGKHDDAIAHLLDFFEVVARVQNAAALLSERLHSADDPVASVNIERGGWLVENGKPRFSDEARCNVNKTLLSERQGTSFATNELIETERVDCVSAQCQRVAPAELRLPELAEEREVVCDRQLTE